MLNKERKDLSFLRSKRCWITTLLAAVICVIMCPSAALWAQTVVSGNITTDTIWTAEQGPYLVTSPVTIQGTDGPDGVTTLTIEPGVRVLFNRYAQLQVGSYSGDPGALKAEGTAQAPIVFTSAQSSPAPGDWYGLRFYNTADDTLCLLDNCLVQYGGYSQGAICLNNASVLIRNTTIRYSKNAGTYATGSGCNLASIKCSNIAGNKYGLWISGNTPFKEITANNFSVNTDYGIYYTGSGRLVAENNWWNDTAGPNQAGDKIYGNVDAEPWSPATNNCQAAGPNHPPNQPALPVPENGSVRVSVQQPLELRWSGGDPDIFDMVSYELKLGTSADNLEVVVRNLLHEKYILEGLEQGTTYYWQVIAHDDHGSQSSGPVWQFTSVGDLPDIIVQNVRLDPGGNLQEGQTVVINADIVNIGKGPVVDSFQVDFKVSSGSVGTVTVNQIIPASGAITIQQTWSYQGGNPCLEIVSDNNSNVEEYNENNNRYLALLSELADITAPELTWTIPVNGAFTAQPLVIKAAFADSQSAIDDNAVIAGFVVEDPAGQIMQGTITEAEDVFTFMPAASSVPDGVYHVRLNAVDTFGNSRAYAFSFTRDTTAPSKPVITGGQVASGPIRPRPVANRVNDFTIRLEGERQENTSIWINGKQAIAMGSGGWGLDLALNQGPNTLEIWSLDRAGNRSESVWVDIDVQPSNGLMLEYNNAGRLKSIKPLQ